MTQAELNQAVARQTGETLQTIRRHGFSLVSPLQECDPNDGHSQPQVLDWDRLEEDRRRAA